MFSTFNITISDRRKKIVHHVVFFKIDTLDCKNVDTQQAFIMNDETQQRAIQTFPEENVLS